MSEEMGREPSCYGLARAQMIARELTRTQRMYVKDGSIHGGCTMATVRTLKAKGLFELVINSPNGQCGFMHLTPLGEAVRAILKNHKTGRTEDRQTTTEGRRATTETAEIGGRG